MVFYNFSMYFKNMYVFTDVDKNVGGVFMTFQSTYTLMPLLIYTKFFRNSHLGLAGESV